MQKLEIEYKSIDELIPYVNNSRTHSKEQVQQIASSIKEFGFTNPVLLDGDNGIIAGHGRLQAAKLLKLNEVPTIQLKDLSEAQKKAYIIADNKLALNAGWDNEILKIEFEALKNADFDLSLLGFDVKELANIFDPLKDANIDLNDEEYRPSYSIIVNCDNEIEQERIFNELDSKGYKCQVQSL